jgi:hypothetical protein
MSKMSELEERVLRTWGRDSTPYALFRAVTAVFEPDIHRPLTLVALQRISGGDCGIKDIHAAAEFLAGEDIALLERRFEFLRNDDVVEISIQDVLEATNTGEFFDPDTGTRVENWERFIVPYYVPTTKLKELASEREPTD